MGEIADDHYEGRCCSLCGCYFAERKKIEFLYTHGHPVACDDCWKPDCGYEKQDEEAVII